MKIMSKKIICFITVISILLLSVFQVNAISRYPTITEDNTELELESVTTITDKETLDEIITNQNLNIPTGYHLEKVDVIVYNADNSENTLSNSFAAEDTIQPMAGLIYEIKNIRVSPKEFYYVNEYDSDWFDGPCTISETYSKECKAKYNYSVGIQNSTVEASLGYSKSYKTVCTKTFSTTVASGKRLNVRIHTNYKSTEFDVYNKLTGNLAEKNCWIAKPIGLIFIQYTYSK